MVAQRKTRFELICEDILKFAGKIFSELGGGFPEHVIQNALAIELREARIPYLKEVNIEIFYHDQCVGTDRPDFILLPIKRRWNLQEPLVLETKIATRLSNDHRQQLKTYLKSLPNNKNQEISRAKKGFLLRFDKADTFENEIEVKSDRPVELELWSYNKRNDLMKRIFPLSTNQEHV